MAAKTVPIFALLLALVSKSYTQRSFTGRTQLWEPGVNPHADRITGGCFDMLDNNDTSMEIEHDLEGLEIPDSFDARQHWPNCPSIREISNQANCGSCWAFGTVEVMTDRICIHSNGKVQFHFSADDLLSCCRNCGGCKKGRTSRAYEYWVKHGIVSGGAYGSGEGCRPYEIHPVLKYLQSLSLGKHKRAKTPKCVKKCVRSYNIPYKQDLHFGKTHYRLPNNVKHIQAEIMRRGPVTAGFTVYADFRHNYTGKGIYHYSYGKKIGSHAVKLIGWGVENGIDYWIVANSWGKRYGDNGFFKFIRGQNDCGIEHHVLAGVPSYS